VIVAELFADPPAPVQVSVYVPVEVRLVSTCVPLVAFVPVHAPLAVQDVVLALLHVSVEEPPDATLDGVAEIVTVGSAGGVVTVIVAFALREPPAPVQVSVYVPVEMRLVSVWLPDVALLRLHAPEATQLVALTEPQFKVDEPPEVTLVGLAVKVTVGAGGADTVTVADAVAEPPAPVQVTVYVPFAVMLVTVWLPEVDFAPLHAPDATQLVALVEPHVIVEDPPEETFVGFAVTETVGAGFGGGLPRKSYHPQLTIELNTRHAILSRWQPFNCVRNAV